ncbi:ATP:cob(I)alamin adenosyltransferase [Bradyrhizobium sp. USDA 4509]
MVVLNRIYTRTGDDGTTALGSGERRPKYDLRIAAYGTVDETNAAIGVVRLHLAGSPEVDAMLGRIQNDLFDLGADLAVPEREGKAERLRMLASQVERLERDIDSLNDLLAPLTSFVLPRRHACLCLSASRPDDMSPRGTDDGGTRRPTRRAGQSGWHPVYEPAVGFPVRCQPLPEQ